MRSLILLALVAAACVAIVLMVRREPLRDAARLVWVADAHQLGPVGYRDPAGALSPDGRWIAYSEGGFLRVRPAGGGPIVELPPGEAQIRNVAWSPDSRMIVADGFESQTGWALYDRVAGSRRALWSDHDPLTATLGDKGAQTTTAKAADLWAAPAGGGPAHRLTSFSRDTYAPTVSADGSLLFKVQSYRTIVALAPAESGPSQPLATFQSETPSWDPTGRFLGITYGTW